MSLYQMSDPNLPNYESNYSVRDIDRDIVSTMNQGGEMVPYYDYDVAENRLLSGPSDSKILAPVQLDSGIPQRRSDRGSGDPKLEDIIGPDFLLGDNKTSLTERIDSVNNGRVGDIEVLDLNLPKEGDIVINKDNQDTSVKGIVEKTAVSDVFFSDMNTDIIQQSIRYGVNRRTGKVVSRQSENTIYIIMRSILLQYANFRVGTEDLAEEIKALNSRVVEYCAENIASNVQQYIGYIKDLEKLPVPMDRPVYHNKNNFTYDISNLL